jgi:3-phosphoshikimate 1-carboxyvinyltransferase
MQSRVSGIIAASPSKSATHRAIVLAALSNAPSLIRRALRSEDTEATIEGVAAFGAHLSRDGGDLRVTSDALRVPTKQIDARNSGTTLRLLSGVASLVPGTTTLTGDSSLQKRPMGPLLDALRALGVEAASLGGDGRPPVEIRGVLRGGSANVPGDVSSQFLSSLLVVCPLAGADSEIRVLPPVRSEPYVQMTCEMMHRFGVDVTVDDGVYRTRGRQAYRGTDVDVPGDFSSSAFPLVAAAITDGDVTVTGLDVDEPQGDRAILGILRSFGAQIDISAGGVRVRGGRLTAQTVDIGDTPDLFPILAVLASQAEGETRFLNGSHLRFKESDRIEATVSMIRGLGGHAEATEDGCLVSGPSHLLGGSVDTRGDHRILMAGAVAGLVARGSTDLSDPWSFRVSYPSFLADFQALGALHAVVA